MLFSPRSKFWQSLTSALLVMLLVACTGTQDTATTGEEATPDNPEATTDATGGCPKPPQMDARFCDRDGDLVADAPTDPAEFVNPDTLIFAYTPVEDPAVYEDVWAGFIEHLAKVTGKEVEFFAVDSNAAQLEAMRAGRLHVAGFNTGSVPYAVNLTGFVPFAIMAAGDDSYGYEMEIITHKDSDIQKVEDLKGKQLAFTEETSNSGYLAPSAILKGDFNLVAETDYEPVFSGGHDASILGVQNKDYEAASIANSVLKRMCARGAADCDQIRSIYKSKTFPTTGYGYVYNLDPELAEKVKEAFFTFDWTGTALAEEFSENDEEKFLEIDYKKYWGVIRDIQETQEVEYKIE